MKYCTKCYTLFQRGVMCDTCSSLLQKEVKENDPVFLITANGFERDRIVATLSDSNIPCIEKPLKKEHTMAGLSGVTDANVKILVPFGAFEKSQEILIGMGAIKADAKIVDENADDNSFEIMHEDKKTEKEVEQFEEMSDKKRLTVRIISAILFIALAALAIFGVDYIALLIQNLFN